MGLGPGTCANGHRVRRSSGPISFKFSLMAVVLLVSFLLVGLVPTSNVAASHEVYVSMQQRNDGDRIVPTNNLTVELQIFVDYSGAASGDTIVNVSILVPEKWDITEWAARGDNGINNYWEDEDGFQSEGLGGGDWKDPNDIQPGEMLNLTGYGNRRIDSGENREEFRLRVTTPPGRSSGIYNWAINVSDDNGGNSTHYLFLAAADADDVNGYDIAIDVRDAREVSYDRIVNVTDSKLILPGANLTAGTWNGLDTLFTEVPDYVEAHDVLVEDPDLMNDSGLIMWEDNEAEGGHFYSEVTGGGTLEDVDDSLADEQDYYIIVYPDNDTALSPLKINMAGAYETVPGQVNSFLAYCEQIETFRDASLTHPHTIFTTRDSGRHDVYVRLTTTSTGGGDDNANQERIIEVGDYGDMINAGESNINLRDNGDDGIYVDPDNDPFDISASAGHWASVPANNTTLRVEATISAGNMVSFNYIYVDSTPPAVKAVSISSNKTVYFYENDTDVLNNDDNVWFNSLAGEGEDQNISISLLLNEAHPLNMSGSLAFGDQPMNDTATGDTWNVSYTIESGAGTISVKITVWDQAGQNTTYNVTFKVDNVDPAGPSNVQARPDSTVDVGEYDDDQNIFVTWVNGTDSGSGMKEHRMGNSSIWTNDAVHVSGDKETGEEGPETFHVFAVDNVGNVAGANDSITIDLTDPVIDNITITSDCTWFLETDTDMSDDDDRIYFNSKDGEGSGQTIIINVSWSDVNMNDTFGETAFGETPTDSAEAWLLDYTIESGANTVSDLKVTVRDKANRTANYTVDLILDNVPPDAPDLTFEEDPLEGYDDDGTVNVTWAALMDAGSGLSHYQVRIDSGAWVNVTDTERSWTDLADGVHIVEARAIDLIGNLGPIGNGTVVVDLTAPVITDIKVTSTKADRFFEWDTDMNNSNDKVYFNSLQGEGAGQVITIQVSFNESNVRNVTGSGAFGDSPMNMSGILKYSLEAGANTTDVTVTVTDVVLRTSTYSLSMIQDNQDPNVDAGPDLVLKANGTHEFNASDATDNVQITSIEWFFGDSNSQTGAVVTHSYSDRGVFIVLVRATDIVGNVGTDQALVTVNTGPIMEHIEDQDIYEGNAFDLQVIAHDPDHDILTFEDDTDLFDIDPSTGLISFTPQKAHVGVHKVILNVTDGIASDSQDVIFTVLVRNAPPVIEGVPDQIITRFNTDYHFDLLPYVWDDHSIDDLIVTTDSPQIKVSDVNNLMLTMNYPRSMEGQNQMVIINVSDGEYSDEDTFMVRVGSNYPPEIIQPMDDQTFEEDGKLVRAFSLNDHFRDQEDLTDLEFNVFGNKKVKVDIGNDNSVNLSAEDNWFGLELITFRVYDSGQAFVEDSFVVTVTPVNDPPAFKQIPDLFIRYEEIYNLILTKYLVDVDDPLRTLSLSVTSVYSTISADNSVITMLFPESMNGTKEVITITASDGQYKDEVKVNVTVSDNYPPVLERPLPDVTFEEDSIVLGALNLANHFSDKDDIGLTFQVLWNDSVYITITPGFNVDFTAAPDFFGVESITIRAVDARGAFVDDDIEVTVTPVNDAPVISPIPDQEEIVGRLWRLDLIPYLSDVDDDLEDLDIRTDNPKVTVIGSALLFQYDQAQEDVVLITVSDGKLEDQTSFIVRIKDETGPPQPPTTDLFCSGPILWLLILVSIICLAALIGYMATRRKPKPEDKGLTIEDVRAEVEKAKATIIVAPAIVVADEPEELELGMNYLFEDDMPAKTFKTIHSICDGKVTGIAISAKHPKKLNTRYALKFVKVFWLSDLQTDVPALDPGRLDFEIMKKISDFMKKDKDKAMVLLDGIRQMTMATSYNKVLEFLKDVCEVASSNGSTVLVLINPKGYSIKDRSQLEDIFDEVRRFTKVETEGPEDGLKGEVTSDDKGG